MKGYGGELKECPTGVRDIQLSTSNDQSIINAMGFSNNNFNEDSIAEKLNDIVSISSASEGSSNSNTGSVFSTYT